MKSLTVSTDKFCCFRSDDRNWKISEYSSCS